MTAFETARLTAARCGSIPELLDVHLSNPAYLEPTEGSGGVAGGENPNDGWPWIGLLMIHAAHQRRGLGAKAIAGLAAHGRAACWTRLCEGVIDGNAAGMALALAVGMREIERKQHRVAAGEREPAVMELDLRAPPGTPPDRPR